MSSTITWKIDALDCRAAVGELQNVVSTIHWRANAQDDATGITASIYSTAGVTFDPEAAFVDFTSLTEQQVLDWLWNSGVDKDQTEQNLQSQLDALITPAIVTPSLPWAGTTLVPE